MTRPADPELMTKISCKHYDEHNYKKNSGRYHHPKSNPNDADEESSKNQKNDKRRKALAVEENTGEKNEESCTSSSSSESDSSEDEKGFLCLFSQEDSDEEMCLMAEEKEVTSQNQSFNYSSESVCHENPREAFEKMMKSFYGIEDSHLKLKEENAKLLAERQDLEDLKSKNAEMLESISQLEKQRAGEAWWRRDGRCSCGGGGAAVECVGRWLCEGGSPAGGCAP
nr:uncharacterized protein LOC109163772 [Ipomoea trifida]